MRGIISGAAHIPYWRLERSSIGEFHGARAPKGVRTVAGFDEDTTTMATEAGRAALGAADDATGAQLGAVWLTTTSPTYVEKSNAGVAHAALRLPSSTGCFDAGTSLRSTVSALRTALESTTSTLLLSADIRVGLAGGPDEAAGGDAAAAVVVGEGESVIAEYLGSGSATREFLDRWRRPGDAQARQWEEKFSQTKYEELATPAWTDALKNSGVVADDIDDVIIATTHSRAARAVGKRLGVTPAAGHDETIGNCGAAEALLRLVTTLEGSAPGRTIALVSLADGVDVLIFRTTSSIAEWEPQRSVADQVAAGNTALPYAKYLAWRDVMAPQPPNRPAPARMSGTAAGRSVDWKYGFVASRDRSSGAVHMPPSRVSFVGGAVDDMDDVPMADVGGTVVTATIDRLAYSPSPPVIFAVVDFDGGGRLPVEICDCTPEEAVPGLRVEMTFRRLSDSDGISNYFWKARPVRAGSSAQEPAGAGEGGAG